MKAGLYSRLAGSACQENEGFGGGDRGARRTSGAGVVRPRSEMVADSGTAIPMPPGMTAISVVSSVSGSAEQLHARRAVSVEELLS